MTAATKRVLHQLGWEYLPDATGWRHVSEFCRLIVYEVNGDPVTAIHSAHAMLQAVEDALANGSAVRPLTQMILELG